jgi:N-acetylglutamate synthase-like GNAT family acetyltransferase
MEQNITYKKPEENEIAGTKEILLEYIKWLNTDLCFQNIEEELNNFPEKYQEPDGAFIIAKENDNIAGCVGLKRLDNGICEMKRLFVTDNYKGKGIGKKLVERIIEEAKSKKYEIMRLDTFERMESALGIYYKTGFYKIESYYNNPCNGVVYLEKKL